MRTLDVADLVVIGGQVLGIGTDVALVRCDIAAAQAALAEAALTKAGPTEPGLADMGPAAAAIGLVHALLRHRPFPGHGERVAVAAGLQFLSLNGWQPDLDPPEAAAVVVEALASGRLSQADAAAWLLPRLSPSPGFATGRAHMRALLPSARSMRAVPVAALAVALAGVTVLATACSRGMDPVAAHQSARPAAVEQPKALNAELGHAACLRSHGFESLPAPSATGAIAITAAVRIDLSSPAFRSAELACR